MNPQDLIQIIFASIFINNIVLVRMLGLCQFFCTTRSLSAINNLIYPIIQHLYRLVIYNIHNC
jgi:Na+-translocating ferredoxin:NAD+ oxidoreductase RnfA subunit